MLHYYGDLVRKLFLAGALVMLVTLPVFRDLVPLPISASALVIVVLTLIAAFTNPEWKPLVWANVVVSIAAVILFEYYAVGALRLGYWDMRTDLFFWTNHVLALDFVIALYFSSKTLRGMLTEKE